MPVVIFAYFFDCRRRFQHTKHATPVNSVNSDIVFPFTCPFWQLQIRRWVAAAAVGYILLSFFHGGLGTVEEAAKQMEGLMICLVIHVEF